jgi:hypothetical protein
MPAPIREDVHTDVREAEGLVGKRSLGALLSRIGLNVQGQLRARRLEMAVWATFWTTRRAGIGVLRF